MNLPNLPHITSTIARFLLPDIKPTLRLALSCSSTFATIAIDAPLWRSLDIHNEEIEGFCGEPWKITDCPDLVALLTIPNYTDQSRKIGTGRMQRSLWFRCATMIAMQFTANLIDLTPHIDHKRSDEFYLSKGLEPHNVPKSTVSKSVANGQWDKDVEPLDVRFISISPDHNVPYRRDGDDDDWSDQDTLTKFIDHPIDHSESLDLNGQSGLELIYTENAIVGASVQGRSRFLKWQRSGLKLEYTEDAMDAGGWEGKVGVEWWKNSGLEMLWMAGSTDGASVEGHIAAHSCSKLVER
ncbi:hypothetical protein HK097_008189 [Rhizophlyctis rosea]|uniref:Uncharacterized protein n=1 Tax=Rhizophlyctis rosea TaxID=64517 RepID=A0AAD5SIE6_9FUNG|nr:hypothetical protein HK097_008189 [Rhizophlyctis rosea]